MSSPPSMASSPDSDISSDLSFSPIQLEPAPSDVSHPSLSALLELSGRTKSSYETPDIFSSFGCGFCNQDTACVCREVVLQHATDRMAPPILKIETYEQSNNPVIALEPHRPSILDNLPAYQPPVPLRRRPNAGSRAPVFRAAPAPATPANCSGDPNNCMACANDSFGQAFCAAISTSVAASPPCADCPGGDACSKANSSSNTIVLQPAPTSPPSYSVTAPSDPETIPTNDAWQQIKSHPNVSFADLSLLADVVARRSKCTGPRVSLSPPPESPSPNGGISPHVAESQSILLTDPHAHYHEKERQRSSPPRLVPEDVLLRCEQQRVRQVHAAGVRDALRLLDAKFS